MKTATVHQSLGIQIQQRIKDYLEGRCTRLEMADWAVHQIKSIPPQQLEQSRYGELVEYVLCRLTDDDWVGESEYRDEMQDLLARLQRADLGEVVLP